MIVLLCSAAKPAPPTCKTAEGFRYEKIMLPPDFAPQLPKGVEELWFAPGMFDPKAQDYFSYAFSLSFDTPPKDTPAELKRLLELYYRGLVQAVGASKKKRYPAREITAQVLQGGALAKVRIFDAFVTSKPLTLNMKIERKAGCYRFLVSPKPPEDAVWKRLQGARSCLPCAR